jgi:hypothetical protein
MAIKLMEPVNKELPFFQPNQVLTNEHLNDLTEFLFQQERFTRSKLIGTGIVCGLSFSWTAAGANASVLIDEGCAITSLGNLILYTQPVKNNAPVAYTHRRNFKRLHEIEPFKSAGVLVTEQVFELITLDEFTAEPDASKAVLADNDKTNRVLMLLLDREVLNPAKCLDENCDDKGKVYKYTIRPLLINKTVADNITNMVAQGRGWKGIDSNRGLDSIMKTPLLFGNGIAPNLTTADGVKALFKAPVTVAFINTAEAQINNLVAAYPWIFERQYNCMKNELVEFNNKTPGTRWKERLTNMLAAINDGYVQYIYDHVRDVTDAYNELTEAVSELISECGGGDEALFPFHVLLGIPGTNDALFCYHEQKFGETNFRYRTYFTPSPIIHKQGGLYEKVQGLFKRLLRLIGGFQVLDTQKTVKVTPSGGYDQPLRQRAVPYYYYAALTTNSPLRQLWNHEWTQRNKAAFVKGYQLFANQNQLIDTDIAKNDFFRIEGHIGKAANQAVTDIEAIRNQFNLPFTVKKIPIAETTLPGETCTWPDIQEAYNYYRDRVLGYLKDMTRYWEFFKKQNKTAPKKAVETIDKGLDTIREILKKTRCIEQFPYNEFKKWYTEISAAFLEIQLAKEVEDNSTDGITQQYNIILNLLNIWMFTPIYKIWFAFTYRQGALQKTLPKKESLALLSAKNPGLEHLAGVRRSHTFLLVHDTANLVVADFCMPSHQPVECDCGCKTEPCTGDIKTIISPMQKPIVMVINDKLRTETLTAAFSENPLLSKLFAVYDHQKDTYTLRLDDMGFYKADSDIEEPVRVQDAQGGDFQRMKAVFEKEELVLTYSANREDRKGGITRLSYTMRGAFDEQEVTGSIFLVILGVVPNAAAGVKAGTYTVSMQATAEHEIFYPYDRKGLGKVPVDIESKEPMKIRTIGVQKAKVFNTPKGNVLAIMKDENEQEFIKAVKLADAGMEELPLVLKSGDMSTKTSMFLNVVDKQAVLDGGPVKGRVTDITGAPVKDAKVIIGRKEVLTNDKGEYIIEGVKAGDVLRVEAAGKKIEQLQVAKDMATEIRVQPEKTKGIASIDAVNIPGFLKKIAGGLSVPIINNL